MTETIRVDWSDVKGRFIDSVRHGKGWNQAMQVHLRDLNHSPRSRTSRDKWAGGNGADTLGWLDDGYYSDDLTAQLDVIPTSEETYVGWHEEEGDIDAGRLLGGYDEFYLNVEPHDAQPGLKLVADVFFANGVKASTIRSYGAWLVGLISGLESAGYDLEIGAVAPVANLYGTGRTGKRSNVEITVKRAGEMSDFTEWSALFGPTGTRHLLFTAYGVASESIGQRQTEFMSTAVGSRKWGVRYDAEANELHITADQTYSGEFPAEMMNAKLSECGLI